MASQTYKESAHLNYERQINSMPGAMTWNQELIIERDSLSRSLPICLSVYFASSVTGDQNTMTLEKIYIDYRQCKFSLTGQNVRCANNKIILNNFKKLLFLFLFLLHYLEKKTVFRFEIKYFFVNKLCKSKCQFRKITQTFSKVTYH